MIRPADQKDNACIADLHAAVLPDSIFVRLGRYFLERYYYKLLSKRDSVFAYVYEYNGKITGFIAMAASHKLFYSRIKKDILPLGWALARSCMASPKVFIEIVKSLMFLATKDKAIACDAEGELLQIVVDENYRVKTSNGNETDFFKNTGTRIAESLFFTALEELKRRRVKDFRIMTGESNIASNRFYAKMGCRKAFDGVSVFNQPTRIYKGNVEEMIGLLHHTGV